MRKKEVMFRHPASYKARTNGPGNRFAAGELL
jgi:hypothetical protein